MKNPECAVNIVQQEKLKLLALIGTVLWTALEHIHPSITSDLKKWSMNGVDVSSYR